MYAYVKKLYNVRGPGTKYAVCMRVAIDFKVGGEAISPCVLVLLATSQSDLLE